MSVFNCSASLGFSQHIVTHFIMLGSGGSAKCRTSAYKLKHDRKGLASQQRQQLVAADRARRDSSVSGQSVNLVRDSDFAAMKQ